MTALFCLALLTERTSAAQTPFVSPPTLTAAFLYTVALFTEWPAKANPGALTLCVLGDPAVAESLDRLTAGRKPHGRDIAILRLATAKEARPCHLLYLSGHEPARLASALDEVAGLPLLTIGDGEQFVRIGGVAGLFVEAGRMRFAINTDAAGRAGLRLSSQLLSLAKLFQG